MKYYKLHNKHTSKDLVYPSIGLWNTPDLDDAERMQEAVRVHLRLNGLDYMCEKIVIRDMRTDKEIS